MNKKKIIRIIIVVSGVVIAFLIFILLYLYPKKIFKDNEKLFEEAGKRYYEVNYASLPKEENRTISVSLDTLIKKEYIKSLHVPYHKDKLCDLKSSTVKAVNKNGKYIYYTYLKCGNYESNTDHEGPVITLNGDMEMTLNKGSEYKELGIKSITDNTDGNMDISKVSIKGTVDTSKVGIYEITYTIRDSLSNKTTVTRKIKVEESLNSIVKANTENNYYKGNVSNNYLMFNNILFRIVKVNSDDTITIVSDSPLANVDYTNKGRFENSTLDKWLNDYFYNLLEEKYKKLIASSKWCDDVITKEIYNKTDCTRESAKRNIGLLAIEDYNNSLKDGISYLDLTNVTWYTNLNSDNIPWALTTALTYPNGLLEMDMENLFNVRPAITLKKNVTVQSGSGTEVDPYILINPSKSKRNSSLNKKEIGEYINYQGYLYRITNITDTGKTEVIMDSVLTSNDLEVNISYENGDKEKVYNPNDNGNIAYQIKNNMTRYLTTKLFDKQEIKVPIYKDKVTYLGAKKIKKYELLITIPSTFDIFSAKGKGTSSGGYWLIDSSLAKDNKTIVRAAGTTAYLGADDYTNQGVKIKAYFKDNVIITSGNGTRLNPYKVSS